MRISTSSQPSRHVLSYLVLGRPAGLGDSLSAVANNITTHGDLSEPNGRRVPTRIDCSLVDHHATMRRNAE